MMKRKPIQVMTTLWPEMPHYKYFAADPRITGIRLNTAKAEVSSIEALVKQAVDQSCGTDLFFDVKGRQLRVASVEPCEDHLELDLNHEVDVKTPCVVLFKGGTDPALLVKAQGRRLVFEGGPQYMVTPGDSLNIRAPYRVKGPLFPEKQQTFLRVALDAGITRFMLSYTRSWEEVEELRTIVGDDAKIICKIEDADGLHFAKNDFMVNRLASKPDPSRTELLLARGDLFVELERPHDMVLATKDLIRADERAIAGSRILLSVTEEEVPSAADLSEVAWLLDLGYRRFMFCDGLCLNKEALNRSVNILEAVAESIGYQVWTKR